MLRKPTQAQRLSPTRLLEMLSDRFGAFEAIASSSIKLARVAPEEELAMDVLVAEAVLKFAEDLPTGWLKRTHNRALRAAAAGGCVHARARRSYPAREPSSRRLPAGIDEGQFPATRTTRNRHTSSTPRTRRRCSPAFRPRSRRPPGSRAR